MGNFMVIFFSFIIIILVVGALIINIVKVIFKWSNNNKQPKLTVKAKVVAKKQNVLSVRQRDANSAPRPSSTATYHVTFEIESGECMEFYVISREYAELGEEDTGNLTYQGTRYLGFERTI